MLDWEPTSLLRIEFQVRLLSQSAFSIPCIFGILLSAPGKAVKYVLVMGDLIAKVTAVRMGLEGLSVLRTESMRVGSRVFSVENPGLWNSHSLGASLSLCLATSWVQCKKHHFYLAFPEGGLFFLFVGVSVWRGMGSSNTNPFLLQE